MCPSWWNRANGLTVRRILQIGDIVLFTKVDSVISSQYQYGIITDVEPGKDGVVRKVKVSYRNSNESSNRETYRSVRNLVLIQSTDEFDLMEELAEKAKVDLTKMNTS